MLQQAKYYENDYKSTTYFLLWLIHLALLYFLIFWTSIEVIGY
jgi:hypothetical protein